jgi:hypothetical protein
MPIRSKKSQYHFGHRLEAAGHVGEPEGRNRNIEIERVDASKDTFGDAKWLKRSFAAPKNLTNGNKRRTFHVG